MSSPDREESHAAEETTSVPHSRVKVVKAASAAKPMVYVLGNDGQNFDSLDETMTLWTIQQNMNSLDAKASYIPQTSSSSTDRSPAKRKRSGGPKKSSAVWGFYSDEKNPGFTTCIACPYDLTPAGHTGNAVTHIRNNHYDLYEIYESQEQRRKEKLAEQHHKSNGTNKLVQPRIRFKSSDPRSKRGRPRKSNMSKTLPHSRTEAPEETLGFEDQDDAELDVRPVRKRENYISWEEYFMSVAFLSAQRSKDPSSQVGACIVDEENKIVGIGYNGMPKGCNDDELPWAREGPYLETKYPYVVHAEQNAIMNKNAASLKGCTVYVGLFPCNECAKLCIQAGIKEIVFVSDKYKDQEVFIASRRLLDMAGIKYRQFIPRERSLVLNFDVIDPALFAAQT